MKPFCQALVLFPLGLAGALFGAAPPQADTTGSPRANAVVNDRRFHERLRKIAEVYTVYGRVDDEARSAPELCRLPLPARARFSRSSDETTHGQKLYSLFARDRAAYLGATAPVAVGQVVVKESWAPVEVKDRPKVERFPPPGRPKGKPINPPADLAPIGRRAWVGGRDSFHPFAKKAGKWYKADRQGDLFLMMKLDPKTAGTDEGWVYGTVSADGKTVTSAGRVASCMKCRETRPTRLFGLPAPEKKKPTRP